MALEKILNSAKPFVDRYLDPAMFLVAANGAYLWLSDRGLSEVSQKVESNEGIAMAGAYALLGLGLYQINKRVFWPVAKRIYKINKKRNLPADKNSWIRTGVQAIGLATLYLVSNFSTTLSNFKYDAKRVTEAFRREANKLEDEIEEQNIASTTPLSLRGLAPRRLSLREVAESNMYSSKGRFLRTARFDKAFTEAEKRHSVEKDLLHGLAMHESYGNPIAVNSGGDGGAGLMMFQPGTARAFGLKIYGGSRATGADRSHGTMLRGLLKSKNYDYEKLAAIDERFDVRKSIDAAARYLKKEFDEHRSWDATLSAYNRGSPALVPSATKYVRNVRNNQNFYQENIARYR